VSELLIIIFCFLLVDESWQPLLLAYSKCSFTLETSYCAIHRKLLGNEGRNNQVPLSDPMFAGCSPAQSLYRSRHHVNMTWIIITVSFHLIIQCFITLKENLINSVSEYTVFPPCFLLKSPYHSIWNVPIFVLGVPKNSLTCMQG